MGNTVMTNLNKRSNSISSSIVVRDFCAEDSRLRFDLNQTHSNPLEALRYRTEIEF